MQEELRGFHNIGTERGYCYVSSIDEDKINGWEQLCGDRQIPSK